MNFSSSEDSASSSSAWDISEPIMNLSKACAEVKLGKKKSASKDKILNKIQTAKLKAQEIEETFSMQLSSTRTRSLIL
ncbi:hypothetical protein F2Q68_00006060 [Brassica cretica]|uniref:Uncharacterized protein n=1 Tax=Brassica cretica TaxID=69181 RepID=A0A8S9JB73_BRACR|nr:hypothetical protein F2Q68_00006060 [Brassica cretica]